MRHRTTGLAAATILLACAGPGDAPASGAPGSDDDRGRDEASAVACTSVQVIATLPTPLQEASGITSSRRRPGVFWVHNDSRKEAQLYAVDTAGRLLATVAVPTAPTPDWEDIAGGPCPTGYCLYVADIGDNLHDREDRAIVRIPEPDPAVRRIDDVARFPIRYPDGPRDAEALFVLPDTSIFIITKGRSGPVAVYRYPPPLRLNERVALEPVQQLTAGLEQLPDLVTGAAASRTGDRIAVRTYTHLQLYRLAGDTLAPLLSGRGYWLGGLREPQGEGVALAQDGTVFLVSEAGPSRAPAPLSRLRCD